MKCKTILLFAISIFGLAIGMSTRGDAAVIDVAAGGSISRALAKASPGDTIRIAPGKYGESLKITKPRLIVTSATEPGAEPDVIVEGPKGTALVDPNDTIWRGVAFVAKDKNVLIANLEKFSGRVEYCRFDSSYGTPSKVVAIVSGSGAFHGTVFANQTGNNGEGVKILSGNPKFTYCRFENLAGGAVSIKNGGAQFVNCLFVRNTHVLNRIGTSKSVEMTNCIFFLNTAADLFTGATAPPVIVDQCVNTPSRFVAEPPGTRNTIFTETSIIEKQKGLTLRNTYTASPRFVSLRRRAILNFGIDDNRCIPVWYDISKIADKYKYPVTLAAHATYLTPQRIELLEKGRAKGHEIASHGMSHAPLYLADGLIVSNQRDGSRASHLSLGADYVLKIYLNDTLTSEIPLGPPEKKTKPSLGQLVAQLSQAGVKARITDDHYRDIPAFLLDSFAKVDLTMKNFSPTLGLNSTKYMVYEIGESKKELDRTLKLDKRGIAAITYPQTIYSKKIAETTEKSGYICGRVGDSQRMFSAYEHGFDPYAIFGKNLRHLVPAANVAEEKMSEISYTLLDFLNDSGATAALYSHAENELTVKNWGVLLKAIHDDGQAEVMTLTKMTETMKKKGKMKDGRYFLTPGKDLSDYRLRADSPLKRAGKPSGLTHDFEGKPLPKGNPSIGLYQ